MMKYKEFRKWCSDRTFDGCWGLREAITCIGIIEDLKITPLLKRKKKWLEYEAIASEIVIRTNAKIEEVAKSQK